ncbi:putative gustatory receptor 28b isoform X4 [Hermetia illucens]|nr:putative gustatory receptor 28b isoform X4 [Hermetia illucens]
MKIIEMSPFRIFSSLSWMLVQSFAIVMNIHVCSKASKAMANTGPLLHNIQSLSDNRSVFQTAQMFSLQILHRNISFTAAGFFNLDYKLITSIVAAVTTYLVIIIQFHLANQQSLNLAAAGSRLNLTSN